MLKLLRPPCSGIGNDNRHSHVFFAAWLDLSPTRTPLLEAGRVNAHDEGYVITSIQHHAYGSLFPCSLVFLGILL